MPGYNSFLPPSSYSTTLSLKGVPRRALARIVDKGLPARLASGITLGGHARLDAHLHGLNFADTGIIFHHQLASLSCIEPGLLWHTCGAAAGFLDLGKNARVAAM